MTTTDINHRNSRANPHEDAKHLFAVGQAVRLRGGFGISALSSDIYHITSTLPARGGSPQYRIRNEEERHERMTTQDSLEAVDTSPGGDRETLIERTFGHGQGTETQ